MLSCALLLISIGCYAQDVHFWQFSDDFLQLHEQNVVAAHSNGRPKEPTYVSDWHTEPPHVPQKQTALQDPPQEDIKKTDYSYRFTSTHAYRLINTATACYAIVNLYNAYALLCERQKSAGMLSHIQTPGNYINFMIQCMEISCTALVYKTIAQCIVLCADGNLFDFLRGGLQKVSHLVL